MLRRKFINIKIISLFTLVLCLSFSSHAKINQPYGLFFIEDNQLEEEQEIFAAPTLKTDVHVDVQGLLTTTTVKQYFINPTKLITRRSTIIVISNP